MSYGGAKVHVDQSKKLRKKNGVEQSSDTVQEDSGAENGSNRNSKRRNIAVDINDFVK